MQGTYTLNYAWNFVIVFLAKRRGGETIIKWPLGKFDVLPVARAGGFGLWESSGIKLRLPDDASSIESIIGSSLNIRRTEGVFSSSRMSSG